MLQKPKNRMQILIALGPFASLALFLTLGRVSNTDLDFVEGFLVGFSIVANLAYIYVTTRYLYRMRRQE